MKNTLSFAALCCIFSFSAAADEIEHHHISTGLSLGTIQTTSKLKFNEDYSLMSHDIAYQYRFNQDWALEVGYRYGSPPSIYAAFGRIFGQEFEFDKVKSMRLAGVYNWSLSRRNLLQAKLGIQQYNVKYTIIDVEKDEPNGVKRVYNGYTKSGANAFVGLGWKYQFDSGLSLGIDFDYQPMEVAKTQSFTFNVGYRF
ncbi:porin family protein [Parashewanella curva]|uniref:Porin family protein n=1 Tax=Parashewanella curva TaxID=2338552 RepID=A0A3L8Q2E7_9GAMM|nr:outer membrane beta-barrel protein [Parashewanella curva]RLV61714.1 porin family protein [Parashewanella curva]